MAINPSTRFPTKVNPASGPWPYGEPKDIVAPGDGTGTPWEVGVVKDIMGAQQALLSKAGITPTGTPETATASQYLTAMETLFGRTLPSTTSILTTDLTGVAGLNTLGYSSAGDGGGGRWAATGNTGTPGTTDFSNGLIYDSVGNEYELAPGTIDPRTYGAVGDGAADDTAPIQSAIDTQNTRGGGVVQSSNGTYRCTSQITIKNKVVWRGSGASATIIDFSGAGGSFPDGFCIYGVGSEFTLPSLSLPVTAGTVTVSFGAAHGRVVGSLIQFSDSRNFSFSPVSSGFRAGEFATVVNILSPTSLEVSVPVFATTNPAVVTPPPKYQTSATAVYGITGLRCSIRDLTIRGIGSGAATTGVVGIKLGQDCTFQNLTIQNSPYSLLELNRCYDQVIHGVELLDEDVGTENAGVKLTGCQLVWLDRVHGRVGRAVIEGRSDGDTRGIPNRQIFINECQVSENTEGLGAIRFDGHMEVLFLANSFCYGITLGGNATTVHSCAIISSAAPTASPGTKGVAVRYSGLFGTQHDLRGCQLLGAAPIDANLGLIDWQDGSNLLTRNGPFNILDCTIDVSVFGGWAVAMVANSQTVFPEFRMSDCRITGNGVSEGSGGLVNIRSNASGTNVGWSNTFVCDNRFKFGRLRIGAVQDTHVAGNRFEDCESSAVDIRQDDASPFSTHRMYITGNTILRSQISGVSITTNDVEVYALDNIVMNNSQKTPGTSAWSSFTFFPVLPSGTSRIWLTGNTFGDDQSPQTQLNNYFVSGVDFFVESNNTMVGGLANVLSSSITEKWGDRYDEQNDVRDNSGDLTLNGGVWSSGTAGQRNIVVGTGIGNQGMRWNSGTTSNTAWVVDDPGSAGRFKQDWQHGNNRLVWTIQNTAMCIFTNDTVESFTDRVTTLGTAAKRWGDIFGEGVNMARQYVTGGTTLSASDFTPQGSNAWGGSGGGTVTAISGEDGAGRITITAGSAPNPIANPTITYTLPDGAGDYSINPMMFIQNVGTAAANWSIASTTGTTVVIRFDGTPTPSTTYGFMFKCVHLDNNVP